MLRQKISFTPAGRFPCEFFEAGTKRRLTGEEVVDLPWCDLEVSVLCKVTSLWVNAGRWGASATTEGDNGKEKRPMPEDGNLDCFI